MIKSQVETVQKKMKTQKSFDDIKIAEENKKIGKGFDFKVILVCAFSVYI